MRGRPPKSIPDLKLHGNYREDRHGNRDPQVGGAPEKPEGLSPHAEWLWDLVVREYGEAGPVRALDTAALTACAKLWACYMVALDAAEADPLDKDTRISVTSYYAAWDRSAAKLGLTPRDRRSISIPGKGENKGVRSRNRA